MFRTPPSFFAKTLVFQRPDADTTAQHNEPIEGADWLNATLENVCDIFQSDPIRRRLFLRFLRSECFGVLLVHYREWIAYGWASQPGKGYPPHLPRSVVGWGSYWIFHCHTKAGFRGRGAYTCLLARPAALAHEKGGGPVYIDALTRNTPSLRAILSAAFRPCGVTHTFPLRLPRLSSFPLAGFWTPDEPHPSTLGDPRLSTVTLRREVGAGSKASAVGGNLLQR